MSTVPTTRTRVLVVSPDRSMLCTIRPLLDAAGYDAWQCHAVSHDDRTMLEVVIEGAVQTFHPELLVLDIDFGEERVGWHLIQALRLLPGAASLPWVVCIAAIEYALGLVPHLVVQGVHVVWKPFTRSDLLQRVWGACPPTVPAPLEISTPNQREPSDLHRTAEEQSDVHDDECFHQCRRRRATDGPSRPSRPTTPDWRVD